MPTISPFQDLPVVQGFFDITKVKSSNRDSKVDKASDDMSTVNRLWLEGTFHQLKLSSTPEKPEYETIPRVTMNIKDNDVQINDRIVITARKKVEKRIFKGREYTNISLEPIQYSNQSSSDRLISEQFQYGTMAQFLQTNVKNVGKTTSKKLVQLLGTDAKTFIKNLLQLKDPNHPFSVEIKGYRSGDKIYKGLYNYLINKFPELDQSLFVLFEDLEREKLIKPSDLTIPHFEWALTQNEWAHIQKLNENYTNDPSKYIWTNPFEALLTHIVEKQGSARLYGSKIKRLITAIQIAKSTPMKIILPPLLYDAIITNTNKTKDTAIPVDAGNIFTSMANDVRTWMYSNLSKPHDQTLSLLNNLETLGEQPFLSWNLDPKQKLVKYYDGYIMTARQFQINKELAKEIKFRTNRASQPLVDPDILEQIVISEFQKDIPNGSLDPSQLDAIKLSNKSTMSIITGGPGTGKTTIVKYLLKAWLSQCRNYAEFIESVALMAPTGKAAKRMSEQVHNIAGPYTLSQLKASTIHSRLQLSIDSNDFMTNNEVIKESGKIKLVIIDEASMLDEALMNAVLSKIGRSIKIVILGDVDQIPSISNGKVLQDLIESNVIPTSKLDVTHRNGGVIAENARHIRHGDPVSTWNLSQPEFRIINSPDFPVDSLQMHEFLYTHIASKYVHLKPDDFSKFAVLSPFKNKEKFNNGFNAPRLATALINENVQRILHTHPTPQETLNVKKTPYPNDLGTNFYLKDYIINTTNFNVISFVNATECKKFIFQVINGNYIGNVNSQEQLAKLNNYHHHKETIFNGDTGFIYDIINGVISQATGEVVNAAIIKIDDMFVPFIDVELTQIDLAYAITTHKSQGSEFDEVLVIQPEFNSYLKNMTSRELIYTAVTRAKKSVSILGEYDSINLALATRSNQRITVLSSFLQSNPITFNTKKP